MLWGQQRICFYEKTCRTQFASTIGTQDDDDEEDDEELEDEELEDEELEDDDEEDEDE